MLGTLFVLLVVAFVARKWLQAQKYKDFNGPSPFLSFPFVGHGYLLGSDPASKLHEMKRNYGDVFRLDVGDLPSVVFTTYEQIKEAFSKEVFSGRQFNEIPTLNAVFPVDYEGMENVVKKDFEIFNTSSINR